VVIWTMTPVEVVSALRRLVRESRISEAVAERAEAQSREVVRRCHLVVDIEQTKAEASRLLRLHALRAGDALQLAAALLWSDHAPAGRRLHTFDEGLALAARREGFDAP
jgi:predicted nucleic acid-binding protein